MEEFNSSILRGLMISISVVVRMVTWPYDAVPFRTA